MTSPLTTTPLEEEPMADSPAEATQATHAPEAARELIAGALYEHSNPGCRWADAHDHDRRVYGWDADAVLRVILPGTRATAALARKAEATVERPSPGLVHQEQSPQATSPQQADERTTGAAGDRG
ncbi:hypothetical protein [Streptomyces sp. CRN 30]|uniref:hypothetical protein n=1 Tax=Streptomyces sp. CRN 30 TaxID=3075613 RepID=UPI002A84177F|nr:hypothetical protein [Streptomyces sp. CRN 30]